MKKSILNVALLATLSFAGSAMSATVPITHPLFVNDNTGAIHNISSSGAFTFVDKIILGEKELLTASTQEDTKITNFTSYKLFSDVGLHNLVVSFVASLGLNAAPTTKAPNNTVAWAFGSTDPIGLSPGNYYIEIKGIADKQGSFHSEYSTSAVPVPAAIWLFGSAMVGFLSLSRRKAALAA